jgi:hypothetical protein
MSPSRTRSSATTPPVGVLHFLHIGIDDELALRDHRAREFAGRGPAADAPDEEHHDNEAEQDVLPGLPRRGFMTPYLLRRRPAAILRRLLLRCCRRRVGSSAGGAACGGANSFAKTSSLGPSACARPFNIAST